MKLITVASVLNVKAMHMSIKNTHSEINEPNISLVHLTEEINQLVYTKYLQIKEVK